MVVVPVFDPREIARFHHCQIIRCGHIMHRPEVNYSYPDVKNYNTLPEEIQIALKIQIKINLSPFDKLWRRIQS